MSPVEVTDGADDIDVLATSPLAKSSVNSICPSHIGQLPSWSASTNLAQV